MRALLPIGAREFAKMHYSHHPSPLSPPQPPSISPDVSVAVFISEGIKKIMWTVSGKNGDRYIVPYLPE